MTRRDCYGAELPPISESDGALYIKASRSTETVSDARLQDLINLYDGQAFRGDTVLALEELQRLRHYVATCGGTDNDGRCPMHHLAGLRSSGGASGKFNGCVTCGSTEYPHDCNAPEPSERQPDGYAYRYPDGYIRFSGGREVNGSDPVETIPYYFRRAPEPRDEPLPPCSTCGGETVPFCTSCGYTTTKSG